MTDTVENFENMLLELCGLCSQNKQSLCGMARDDGLVCHASQGFPKKIMANAILVRVSI